ncbi:hypothetical protein [Agrobacterium tumefaciens]|uniref:hypothetical protein n=1 Tax=Agrobacterium tumefaciens TaxID=358 RepID=UPI001573414F|nr:hypothetical protein [Agrobacterium tumefaciens]NTA16049.1 hypothetical protein [Agrobacterium tumefaciens]WCK69621.1 hypothetical protein G6L96_007385 [Agrobacterium tumefaciens]
MGEQRYKVGDWVRVIDNRGAPMDYKKDDVCQVTAVRKDLVYCGDAAMFAKRFEPWQPRVGERVRYSGKSAVYSERELVGLEGKVTELNGNLVNVKWDKTIVDGIRTGGAKYIENLEPVLTTSTPEQPATLKIETGKFYKTRDGRKVGPAFISGRTATFGSTGNYASAVWSDDGRSSRRDDKLSLRDNDIIAEWIDDPVSKPSNDNAKPKFKVGDRVRVVKDGFVSGGSRHSAKIGDEFVLREMNPSKAFWRTNGPDFYEHEIEIVVVATIVALIESGQPKPSSTPHVHTSTGAAEKEAKRLAAKYKGQQFGVFTLTTTHEEAAPVYDHKWQNMAYLGLKIDAIKELRAVAGLTLKGAKDAVEAWIEYENAA